MKSLSIVAAVITVLASPAFAQDPPFREGGAQDPVPFRLGGPNGPKAAAATPDRPVPRTPDGKIDLGGVWTDGGSAPIGRLLKPGELDSLLKPEAKKILASRKEPDDPYFY